MENSLQNITEVVEAYYYKEANSYLQLGWILISSNVISNVDALVSGPCYILGWDKNNGHAKYPLKTNAFDKLRDKYEEATSDFVNS